MSWKLSPSHNYKQSGAVVPMHFPPQFPSYVQREDEKVLDRDIA